MSTAPELFGRVLTFPDPSARKRLSRLVGLDEKKERLATILSLLLRPDKLMEWADKNKYGRDSYLVDAVLSRPPLIVLAGDVGSGKTELAETISDAVALANKIDITLFPLTLATRGRGLVGDMTQLLSAAFEKVTDEAEKLVHAGRANGAIVLLVDEADALAQSRESPQMHHEDKAGVNVLIRGIDQLAARRLPVATIMCTNRIGALDPAVRRRAAEVMLFGRPDFDQRLTVLKSAFAAAKFSEGGLRKIAEATGKGDGCTFSDLTQRYIPSVVLDAFPKGVALNEQRALEIASSVIATPPFVEAAS